ncbi:MAG: alanine--tRNA ligase [Firmicutes bacterium]|nr:alanine--tRNA ligase [Bacillota bacterium]
MQWQSLNTLREKYLEFFESKGHLRLPSFPLVPQHDKSLLLINAGMAPMKKYFTGEEEPPRHRVTTCQRCVRTLDIENVGKTARHGTYFEMLGNFSFGDYFKSEAIPWAWEFLTRVLEIPDELLYATVYENDDEAYDIWHNTVGLPTDHIVRLGRDSNFWDLSSGPCGPCSEIYFDRGEKYGCGKPDCAPGCDCDRYIEIWNNVFTQFNNDGNDNYTELKQKNIDTGMGLERLACVMQGVDNLFEVDTIRKILDTVCSIAGKTYGDNYKNDVSVRVITDHIRTATFLIFDGVLPSNEGRGYILRRVLRRAARHGRLLGIEGSFLPTLCDVVVNENLTAYPALEEKREYIKKIIKIEEERFDLTIDSGLEILSGLIDETKSAGGSVLSGDEIFRLYDTFGFPVDLTREIAAEAGLTVDEDKFAALMKEQRERARNNRKLGLGWEGTSNLHIKDFDKTEFTGYTEDESDAKVSFIFTDEEVGSVSEGEFTLILDRTPFYGEGGGQVGDTGFIVGEGGEAVVIDTKKDSGVYLHICRMQSGILSVGDAVTAKIDKSRREAIRRNHSSVHLLQSALRTVLGNHVEQSGSYVDEKRGRFDFSHFAAMTKDEISRVESLVNSYILSGYDVTTEITDVESAKAAGAMALFGEKYGSSVRMVSMGDVSRELCGGTHVSNTSKIGLFKIIYEGSVAAGVRRIESVTGEGVLELISEKDALLETTAHELKAANVNDAPKRALAVTDELRRTKRELEAANARLASLKAAEYINGARNVGGTGIKLITASLDGMDLAAARELSDKVKAEHSDTVAVFAVSFGGKLNFVVSCGADAVSHGVHAGKLAMKVAALTGGKGGGRPDSAVAGGIDTSKVSEALGAAEGIILEMSAS